MRILITGSNGLLGQKIEKQLRKANVVYLATSKGENRNQDCPAERYQSMDITSKEEIEEAVRAFQPTHIIHTAAMTNVDQCEQDPEACYQVNVEASRLLFEVAQEAGCHFQLLSTDFVFDGEKGNYKEEDETSPLSEYAKSKVAAEELLQASSYTNWSIVRTIIVYGVGNNLSRSNLLVWAKSALPKGDPMRIIDDQFRAPTWADDLAWGCIEICRLNKQGIYHLAGPETYSIFEIVEKVAAYYQWSMDKVEKISSETLDQPAKRPPKTGFDLSKARKDLGYQPKTIEETLDEI